MYGGLFSRKRQLGIPITVKTGIEIAQEIEIAQQIESIRPGGGACGWGTKAGSSPIGNRGGTPVIQFFCAID
jgi:hypothetical protein